MAEDLAFRIQLGLILPKIQKNIGDHLRGICEEVVDIVNAGSVGDDTVDLDEVKQIIMKDLEIHLDTDIFPALKQKYSPSDEEAEGAATEEGEPEAAEEAAE